MVFSSDGSVLPPQNDAVVHVAARYAKRNRESRVAINRG